MLQLQKVRFTSKAVSESGIIALTLLVPFAIGLAEGDRSQQKPLAAQEDSSARIREYLDKLSHADTSVRDRAAAALVRIGPPAVPVLIEALKDNNPDRSQIRDYAVQILHRIGLPAAPALIAVLKNERYNESARYYAAQTLQQLGPDAKIVVPELIEVLKDKSSKSRVEAAQVLGSIGPGAWASAPILVEALKDKDWNLQENSAIVLGKVSNSEVVPAIVEILRSQDDSVREMAALALSEIGPAAKVAIPALTDMLKDQRVFVRKSAAKALVRIGAGVREAVSALIIVLQDRSPEFRSDNIIPDSDEIGTLDPKLKSLSIRGRAAVAIAKTGPDAKAAAPALIEALKDFVSHDIFSPMTAGEVAVALESIGTTDEAAVPALIEAGNKANVYFEVGAKIAKALARFGRPAVRAMLLVSSELLSSEKTNRDEGKSYFWATFNHEMGDNAVPYLIEELSDTRLNVFAATWLISLKGSSASVAALIKALGSKAEGVPSIAAFALGKIGKPAIPALIQALADVNRDVRLYSCYALSEMGPEGQDAVAALNRSLQDPDEYVRKQAALALRKIQAR